MAILYFDGKKLKDNVLVKCIASDLVMSFFQINKISAIFFKTKDKVLSLKTIKKKKMKKQLILAIIIGSTLFVSCKKDEEVKPVEETQQQTQPFSGEAWLKQRIGNQGQVQQQTVQQQAQQTTQTQTAPGMNPPHGQPGHRCDIAVGAPLNSKPAQKTQPQTTPVVNSKPAEKPVMKINSNTTSTTVVGSSTPPGMNPPNGQEGHRCDIAVGAPLPKS